jgi:hypothetical protein
MTEGDKVLQSVPNNREQTSIVYTLDELQKLKDSEVSKVCPDCFEARFVNDDGRFDPEAWFDSQRKQTRSRAASEPRNRNPRPTSNNPKENRRISGANDRTNSRSAGKGNKKVPDGVPGKRSSGTDTSPRQVDSLIKVPPILEKNNSTVAKGAARQDQEVSSATKPAAEKRVRIAEPSKVKHVVHSDEELEYLSSVLRQVILGKKRRPTAEKTAPKMRTLAEIEATLLNKPVTPTRAPSDRTGFYRLISALSKKVSEATTPVSEEAPKSPPSKDQPKPLLNSMDNQFLRHQQWVGPILTCQLAQTAPHIQNKTSAISSSYPRSDADKIEIKDQINYTPSNTSSSSNEQVNAMNISHQVIPTSSDGLHPAIHRQPLLPTPVFHHPTIGAHLFNRNLAGLLLNQSHLALYYQLAQMAANAHIYGSIRNNIIAGNCKNPMGAHLISSGYLPAVSAALVSKYVQHHENLGPYSLRPHHLQVYASPNPTPMNSSKTVAE